MKYSKQREQILEYIRSVKTHPTAETIYDNVKKINPSISLGTVYRNLDKLASDGIILRIKMANSKDRFDGDISCHYHAICVKCNEIIDIFTDYFDEIDKITESKINMQVISHDILFNVVCPKCSEK